MAIQNPLMLVNSPIEIMFDFPEMIQFLLLFPAQPFHINILFLQLFGPALHQLLVILELLLRVTDRLQILQQNFLVILYRIIQGISPDFPHGFLNLLQLDSHQIKDILNLIHCLVIALLFQVHLKNHLMDSQFHIILYLKSGQ